MIFNQEKFMKIIKNTKLANLFDIKKHKFSFTGNFSVYFHNGFDYLSLSQYKDGSSCNVFDLGFAFLVDGFKSEYKNLFVILTHKNTFDSFFHKQICHGKTKLFNDFKNNINEEAYQNNVHSYFLKTNQDKLFDYEVNENEKVIIHYLYCHESKIINSKIFAILNKYLHLYLADVANKYINSEKVDYLEFTKFLNEVSYNFNIVYKSKYKKHVEQIFNTQIEALYSTIRKYT